MTEITFLINVHISWLLQWMLNAVTTKGVDVHCPPYPIQNITSAETSDCSFPFMKMSVSTLKVTPCYLAPSSARLLVQPVGERICTHPPPLVTSLSTHQILPFCFSDTSIVPSYYPLKGSQATLALLMSSYQAVSFLYKAKFPLALLTYQDPAPCWLSLVYRQ